MKKFLAVLFIMLAIAIATGVYAADDPDKVAQTAEKMSYNILRIVFVSIPIVYFIGVVLAATIFAFKSYNRAKNDQVENPGKTAATVALMVALVGFGAGGVLFLAADKWIFDSQYFSHLQKAISNMMSGTVN